MKWIIGLAAVLVLVPLAIWIIGRSLPVAHSATASRTIAAPTDQVWGLISDFDRWKGWRTDLKSLESIDEQRVEVVDRYGKVRYRIERPGDRTLVTIIDSEGLPYGGSWTWSVEPAGANETVVTITEDGEIYNTFFRFMARFVFGYDSTMNSILDQLEASVQPS